MMTTLDEALKEALTPPENYWGSITELVTQGWAQTFSRHRDSDVLEISNYETILTAFAEKYKLNEDYRVEGSSHWAVGWTDAILVRALQCKCEDWEDADIYKTSLQFEPWRCNTCGDRARVTEIFKDAFELTGRLQDYPVLDEMDYCTREYEDAIETLINCYDIPEEKADECYMYLFNEYSVSRGDDILVEWVQEWKEKYGIGTS